MFVFTEEFSNLKVFTNIVAGFFIRTEKTDKIIRAAYF